MTGSDIAVGRAEAHDAGGLLALINLVQPHVPWDRAHLEWQFFAPPAGPARLYVVRDGSTIVSLYAAVAQRVTVAGQTVRGFMVQDVMTNPSYRGRGFLHQLGALCLEEIRAAGDVGYTFPNKLSEGSFRRNGWAEIGLVPRRGAPLPGPEPSAPPAPVQRLEEAFDERATAIWEAAGLPTGVRRDAAFLRWRYGKPSARYERFLVDGEAGFVVLKTFDDGPTRIVHLCDVILRATARDQLPGVLASVFDLARRRGARRLTAWLPAAHPYAPDFDKAGLLLEEHDRYMLVTGPAEMAVERQVWHVTQGDSDVY